MRANTVKTVITSAVLGLLLVGSVAQAQEPPPRPQIARGRAQNAPPSPAPGVGLQELQGMFDAFVLVQAQRVLQLPDEQYQRFFMRMNRLQDVRRQHMRQRMRMLNDLRRSFGDAGTDDAALAAALKAFDDAQGKFEQELLAARGAIEETLSVRQRARFRLFEEEMERQKIEFLTRARQAGRE